MLLQYLLIATATLLPLVPLLAGRIALQDLLAYWVVAAALSVISTLIRLNTMERRTRTTTFLTLHYGLMIGILSVVCGAWALVLLIIAGPSGGWWALLPALLAQVLATAWSLADGWFLRGGRLRAQTWQVVLPGYLRFLPLLGGTVFAAILITGDAPASQRMLVGVGLIVSQFVIDLGLALAGQLAVRRGNGG